MGTEREDSTRIGQDLCIALVLAVVSAGFGSRLVGGSGQEDGVATIEAAIAVSGLSADQAGVVRSLIALARDRESAGDENAAAIAMAKASTLLGIA